MGCGGCGSVLCVFGVDLAWVVGAGGGNIEVGFHALHSSVLSCVEGVRFLVCLIWVSLRLLIPCVWADGLSVAVRLVCGVIVSVVGMWSSRGSSLCRFRGGGLVDV